MDETTPHPAPGGALTLPRRAHATAIAASAPPAHRPVEGRRMSMRESLRGLRESVLDRLDVAADRIADAVGLR